VNANSNAASNPQKARKQGSASKAMSIVGIVLTVIAAIAIVVVYYFVVRPAVAG